MKDLKRQLMEQARQKGICVDGYSEMRTDSIDMLIDYYIQNPDWSMERDYPTLGFLKENFSNIEDKGVYVCKRFHGELLNERQAYIFHNCSGTIKVGLNVDQSIIPMLYLGNKCRMRIVGIGDIKPRHDADRTIVPIYVFGRNDVSAKDNAYVKFTQYKTDMI